MDHIETIYAESPGPNRIAAFVRCLAYLAEDADVQQLASTAALPGQNPEHVARLSRLLDYLGRHWQEPVSLASAAEVAGIHPQSLSRFMKQKLGSNFQNYMVRLRLGHAARHLLDTSMPIADIAFRCGFNNLANFNRHFRRRYGQSPRAYRSMTHDGNS